MQRVFVLDKNRQPLMPCHPARARELLNRGKAAVYRRVPFTLILKARAGGDAQLLCLKLDPGSKTTGLAMTLHRQGRDTVIWAGELNHRGKSIRASLDARRALRRGRRNRKTRYRAKRFLNRTKPAGWLAPSLQHRVDTTLSWVKRLTRLAPVTALSQELCGTDVPVQRWQGSRRPVHHSLGNLGAHERNDPAASQDTQFGNRAEWK